VSPEHLVPSEWTPTEVEVLQDGLASCRADWEALQQLLPHRTAGQIRKYCEGHPQLLQVLEAKAAGGAATV
jgi:hypothetical protein